MKAMSKEAHTAQHGPGVAKRCPRTWHVLRGQTARVLFHPVEARKGSRGFQEREHRGTGLEAHKMHVELAKGHWAGWRRLPEKELGFPDPRARPGAPGQHQVECGGRRN